MLEKYKQVIDKDFTKDADFIDRTIKNFGLDKNSSILDIGTGFGAMSILLAMNGISVLTGQPKKDREAEHDHAALSNWKENAKALNVEDKITFQYLNAESLHFPDDSFDGIFMYDTLQHITNRERALTECIRVMEPRGLICIRMEQKEYQRN